MLHVYLFVFVALVSLSSCTHLSSGNQPATTNGEKILAVKGNDKYKLSCVFYGEKEAGTGEKSPPVKYVTIRDDRTRKEVRYVPSDEDSLKASQGYFTNVWSPDNEYLVLPLGRFKGFCIIKSAAAFKSIENRQCPDYIKVYDGSETALWHEFENWESDGSFVFKAGLSGDNFRFKYSIPNQQLSRTESGAGSFVGENAQGKLSVSK